MEDKRNMRLDKEEREEKSAVRCTEAGCAVVDARRKRTDEVTMGND
jgi:hypothetical protein